MHTLTSPGILDQTLARIAAVQPGDAARWGRMNVNQMLCHLCDSTKVAMGETMLPATNPGLSSRLIKWLALDVPLRWAKSIPTMPQMDQLKDGTPPTSFTLDQPPHRAHHASLADLSRREQASLLRPHAAKGLDALGVAAHRPPPAPI